MYLQRSLVVTWLVPRLGCCVYTTQPCTSLQCHFIRNHIRRIPVCLDVTWHPRFWQNDQDLLRATAVLWGWNGYWDKSQHKKLTTEKKILPPLLPGLDPRDLLITSPALKPLSYHRLPPPPPPLLTTVNTAAAKLHDQPVGWLIFYSWGTFQPRSALYQNVSKPSLIKHTCNNLVNYSHPAGRGRERRQKHRKADTA